VTAWTSASLLLVGWVTAAVAQELLRSLAAGAGHSCGSKHVRVHLPLHLCTVRTKKSWLCIDLGQRWANSQNAVGFAA